MQVEKFKFDPSINMPEDASDSCELCGKQHLVKKCPIINIDTNEIKVVGSSCITKFGIGHIKENGNVDISVKYYLGKGGTKKNKNQLLAEKISEYLGKMDNIVYNQFNMFNQISIKEKCNYIYADEDKSLYNGDNVEKHFFKRFPELIGEDFNTVVNNKLEQLSHGFKPRHLFDRTYGGLLDSIRKHYRFHYDYVLCSYIKYYLLTGEYPEIEIPDDDIFNFFSNPDNALLYGELFIQMAWFDYSTVTSQSIKSIHSLLNKAEFVDIIEIPYVYENRKMNKYYTDVPFKILTKKSTCNYYWLDDEFYWTRNEKIKNNENAVEVFGFDYKDSTYITPILALIEDRLTKVDRKTLLNNLNDLFEVIKTVNNLGYMSIETLIGDIDLYNHFYYYNDGKVFFCVMTNKEIKL